MADLSIQLETELLSDTTEMSGLAKYCHDLYYEYKDSQYRQDKLDEIEESRKRYRLEVKPKTFPWEGCSNKTMGLEAIAVDNLEPRIKAQLIADDDFIHVEPVGAEDAAEVDYVRDMAHWAFVNNMQVERQVRPFIHDLLIDGTKDVIPIWEEDDFVNIKRSMKPVFVDQMGQRVDVPPQMRQQLQQYMQMGIVRQAGMEESVEESSAKTFKVRLDLIDIHESFAPDTWENWPESPFLYFVYPELSTLQELSQENGGPYFGISEDLVVDPERITDENTNKDEDDQGIKHSEYTQEVKLLRCFVKWRGEWMLSEYAIDAGWKEVRRQPVREVFRHGRKPVHRFRLYPDGGSMGTGIPRRIRDFSKGIDDLYNQMIDSGTIEIAPWFFVERAPGSSMKEIKVYPGAVNEIARGSVPVVPQLGVKSPQFITFINLLMEFFERMVSIMDSNLAGPRMGGGRGTQTATGMQLIVQEGNIKHQYMGEALQDDFAALLLDCFELYAQYMPLDAKQTIFEQNQWVVKDIDVLRLQGQYDFRIQVSQSSANAMMNRQEKVELYQLAGGNPLTNQAKLLEELYRAYGIKATDEYIQPQFQMMLQAIQQAPELAQVIQQHLQQKQAQAQEQQITQQAETNVKRQQIERNVEQQNPQVQQHKILDQSQEAVARELTRNQIRAQMGMR